MTTEQLGAVVDKVFFVGVGLFLFIWNPRNAWKTMSPEQVKKRLKIMRVCGAALILFAIAQLLIERSGHA